MHTDLHLPPGMAGWEQLTLFQPEAVSVEMVLHISDRNRYLDGGVRATELLTGVTLHTEAIHWDATARGVREASERYLRACDYWSGVVWSAPSRRGEVRTD